MKMPLKMPLKIADPTSVLGLAGSTGGTVLLILITYPTFGRFFANQLSRRPLGISMEGGMGRHGT